MRFIHLADVHLGAVPDRGCPWSSRREEEIWETFRRVIAGIRENPVDLLFISGDLFHRQPLMRELKEVNYLFSTIPDTRVYLMAGNHDFISRDSFYRTFEWNSNVTFFKNRELTCVKDPELDVYVYGLSYYDREIREGLYDKAVPVQEEGIHILLAHGGDEKHIPLSAASLAAAGFDYVALGHIHNAQHCSRESVRYCGTLLKYSFSEVNHIKSITVVELKEKGKNPQIHTVPVTPLHDMREIKGSYEELTFRKNYMNTAVNDYLHITLTDEEDIPDAISRLRSIYPNIMRLDYDNIRTRNSGSLEIGEAVVERTPLELFEDFYEQQNHKPMSEEQKQFVGGLIESIWE